MAAKKVVELQILLKAAGIKATSKQIDKLSSELKKMSGAQSTTSKTADKATESMKRQSNEANKLKRNLEGVAQRSNRTGKDFSRMSQGMGGLVQVYATIAANVFAISSAFLVLRRAADLSSMIKSAENFSNRFGVSVTQITKQMQEASGGAITFAEALPTINKAVSAGIGTEQLEKLTVAATKASQTFGGSATEALNRFISASQRGRVEIIQTLGVVIKTEDAYRDYAATIGKTAQELSAYDRQQAILNATIEASNEVFDGVKIDPNPFQQLATTMIDLKDTVASFVSDNLTPLLNILNQSLPFALGISASIIKSIASRSFPLFTNAIKAAKAANVDVSKQALASIKSFKAKEQEAVLKAGNDLQKLTKAQLLKRSALFDKYYAEQLKKATVFQRKLVDSQNKIDVGAINARKAQISRELAAREGAVGGIVKGGIKALRPIETKALQIELARLNELLRGTQKNTAKLDASFKAVSTSTVGLAAKVGTLTASTKRLSTSIKSIALTSFFNTFIPASTGIEGMGQAINSVRTSFDNFKKGLDTGQLRIARFAKLAQKAFGLVGGAIFGLTSAIFSFLPTLLLLAPIVKSLYDRFFGLSKATKAAIKELKDLGDAFSSVTENADNFISRIDKYDDNLLSFIKQLEFVRGTSDSISNAFNEVDKKLVKAFGGRTIDEIAQRMSDLESVTKSAQNTLNNFSIPEVELYPGEVQDWSRAMDQARFTIETIGPEFDELSEVAKTFAKENGPGIINTFRSFRNVLDEVGFENLSKELIASADSFSVLGEEGDKLAQALRGDDIEAWNEQMNILINQSPSKVLIVYSILRRVIGDLAREANQISAFGVQAGRSLTDLKDKLSAYVTGLDKLKSASLPGKEILGFTIDAKVALEGLAETAGKAGEDAKKKLQKALGADDLEIFRNFLKVPKGANVQQYLDAVNRKQEILAQNAESVLLTNEDIKTITTKIATEKAKEVRSDQQALDQINNLQDLNIQKLDLELEALRDKRTLLQDTIDWLVAQGRENSFLVQQYKKQRDQLDAREVALEQELERVRESTALEQKKVDIAKEINSNLSQRVKLYSDIVTFIKDTSTFDDQFLKVSGIQVRLLRITNKLKEKELLLELRKVKAKALIDSKLQREVDLINLKLKLLRLQNFEEERIAAIKDRAVAAATDTGFFFGKNELASTAEFFVEEIRKRARDLDTTFETLGRGFAKAAADTFSTAVDTLLEGTWGRGGRDFGRAVKEALKATLRDVIGQAIKDRIMEAFRDLFGKPTLDQQQRQTLIEEIQNQIRVLEENTIAVEENTRSKSPDINKRGVQTLEDFKKQTSSAIGSVDNTEEFDRINESAQAAIKVLQDGNMITKQGFIKNIKATLDVFNLFGKGGFFSSLFKLFREKETSVAIEVPKLEVPQPDFSEMNRAIQEKALAGQRNAAELNSISTAIEESASRTVEAVSNTTKAIDTAASQQPPETGNAARNQLLSSINQEIIKLTTILSNKESIMPPFEFDTTPIVSAVNTNAETIRTTNTQINTNFNSLFSIIGNLQTAIQNSVLQLGQTFSTSFSSLYNLISQKQNQTIKPAKNEIISSTETKVDLDTDSVVMAVSKATEAIKASINAINPNVNLDKINTTINTNTTAINQSIFNNTQAINNILNFLQLEATKESQTRIPGLVTEGLVKKPEAVEISNAIQLQSNSQLGAINTGLSKNQEKVEEGTGVLGNINTGVKDGTNVSKSGFDQTVSNLVTLVSLMGSGGKDSGGLFGSLMSAFSVFGPVGSTSTTVPTSPKPYATGGVIHKPTYAMIGEGKNSEAVVPLPNNREIPVELRDEPAAGDTINIEQNFDFRNADQSAVPRLRAEARAIEDRTFNRVFTEINKGGKYAKIVGRR